MRSNATLQALLSF